MPYPSPAVGLDRPALSVPCGFTGAGLPMGLRPVGRPFEGASLLRVGAAFEAETRWCKEAAPAFGGRGMEGRR